MITDVKHIMIEFYKENMSPIRPYRAVAINALTEKRFSLGAYNSMEAAIKMSPKRLDKMITKPCNQFKKFLTV